MVLGWEMPFLPLLGGVLGGGGGCCGDGAGLGASLAQVRVRLVETYSAVGLRMRLIDRARWIPRAARVGMALGFSAA